MKLKSTIILPILFIIFFLLSPLPIHAQTQPFNLTTSPNAFDLTSEPGKTIKQTFKIRNNGDTPITLKVEIKKLLPTQDGQITIEDFPKEDTYQHWLKIDSASISARPKEWTFVPITIKIPKEAAFGYYWVLLVTPQDAQKEEEKTETKLTGAVAIPVLLSVYKDGMKFDGKLDSFKVSDGFYEYLPATFLTTFSNKGNVHIKPRGNIFITDWRGKKVATLDINKDQGGILPNAKRTFTSTWDDSFISYENQTEGDKKLKIRFDKLLDLRIGQYKAQAVVVVTGDKRDYSFESSTTFFVFPWKIVIGVLLFTAFALLGILSTIKAGGRKISRVFKK